MKNRRERKYKKVRGGKEREEIMKWKKRDSKKNRRVQKRRIKRIKGKQREKKKDPNLS